MARALQSQNADVPGGRMDQGGQSVTLRTRGRIETIDGFGDVVLREVDGHPVRLRDVARVEDGMAEPRTQASVNGEATVLLQIRKQSGTNTVEVANNVKQRLAELADHPAARLPAAHRPRRGAVHRGLDRQRPGTPRSSARFSRRSSCCVFLGNFRSTMIAAISIPTSIVATFALIWYMGFTLNMLTMLALTLSVGIVIDDAIVVLENIYRFIEEKGMPPMQAAVEATQGDRPRRDGHDVVAGRDLRAGRIHERHGRPLHAELRADDGVRGAGVAVRELHADADDVGLLAQAAAERRACAIRSTTGCSSRSIAATRACSNGRWRIAGWSRSAPCCVLLSSVPLFTITKVNFTPEDDQSQFDVTLRAPEGTSLAAMEVLANRLGTAVRRIPEVDFTLITVAGDAAGTLNTATMLVRLHPIEDRDRDQFAVMAEVRDRILPEYVKAGLRTAVQLGGGPGGGGGGAIQFMVQGPDLEQLEKYSDALLTRRATIPGLVDVDTTLNAGKPEMSVLLDRPKAADLGVQIADAADALRLLVAGDQVTTYNEAGEQYEVHLRAEESESRLAKRRLPALPVPSSRLGIVSLDNIATFARSDSPATISRMGRQRQVTLNANMLPGTSQATAQEAISRGRRELNFGPEYRADFAGRSRELNRTATAFLTAIALSFIFMYLILAAQFESWLHPVTILLSLPLTLPFALLSLIIFQQSLNIFSGLGLLVLFGVVKKNSILQIDHANQLRDEGMNTHDAVVQASRDRLRPILMTTLAFVAGMVPLVVSSGVGSATNHAIGWVVIGGQTMVLLVTLLVTPVAYSLFDSVKFRRTQTLAVPETI